ncbi:protein of unknown function [Micropruina glycogenica]|uniref:Uncharacterized protein n=1 Tax=Micropruina glycogenica TaxID=75385 RepID=A0A2N9JDF2_9ACTN|nr:protein of unknown function [Micropruina glycogenica]
MWVGVGASRCQGWGYDPARAWARPYVLSSSLLRDLSKSMGLEWGLLGTPCHLPEGGPIRNSEPRIISRHPGDFRPPRNAATPPTECP